MTPSNNRVSTKSSTDFKRILHYFANVKEEVQKIYWTTPQELEVYTKVIVLAAFFLGMVIYFNDLALGTILRMIHLLINTKVG